MINGLTPRSVPAWLSHLDATGPFPLKEVLEGSLYYPSSGRDGDPVRYLGGFIHSFVYVDFAIAEAEVMASLEASRHRFKGYRLALQRNLKERDLVPTGWTPVPPTRADGRPRQPRDLPVTPFALWAVFDRMEGFGEDHGPSRFSLVFLCGDGVASYQALYQGNGCVPEVVAIIQPGHGFGGNWTDFTDPRKIFARSVLGHPRGVPRYLLCGAWNARPESKACWPGYPGLVAQWPAAQGHLALWEAVE